MANLYFYYSAMNAGKSTILLQSNYNYKERGMDTILFSSSIDSRYGPGKITSRIGLEANAILVHQDTNLYSYVQDRVSTNSNIACVLIDEAQFLTREQIMQLTEIVDVLNIPVLAYGLRTDFKGEPFPGTLYLLALADKLIEVKTVCHCGHKAIMNMRLDAAGNKIIEGSQIVIGGNEMYMATCRKHFKLGDSGVGIGCKIKAKKKLIEEKIH